MMKHPTIVLALVLVQFACASNGTVNPDDPEPPPVAGPGSPDVPPGSPSNLLSEPERAQLYLDLDLYAQRYMTARDEGKPGTWMSLHASVLLPMVDENLDELLSTLGSGDERRFQVIAARGLGFGSDSERIVPALMEVLDAEEMMLLNSALVSIYYQAWPPTPILPLVAKLNHPDGIVRSNAALALSVILRKRRVDGQVPLTPEVKQAAGQLLAAVSDPQDPSVRGHAASALGSIGDPAAADVLINLLADDSSFVRVKAAEGLGQLGQQQAIPPLIQVLSIYKNPAELRIVVAALEKIALLNGFPVDLEALGSDPQSWRSWYLAVGG